MGDEKTPQLPYQMISGYKMPTYEEIKAQIPAITQKVIAVKSAIKSTPSTYELAHYRDNNGEMHTTTTGNGAISGTDPLASFAVDTYIGGKIIGGLTKGAMYGVGKYGPGWIKQKARNHIIGQEFKKDLLPFRKTSVLYNLGDDIVKNTHPKLEGEQLNEEIQKSRKLLNSFYDSPTWKQRMTKAGFSLKEQEDIKHIAKNINQTGSGDIPPVQYFARSLGNHQGTHTFAIGTERLPYVNETEINNALSGPDLWMALNHEDLHANSFNFGRYLNEDNLWQITNELKKKYGEKAANAYGKYLKYAHSSMADISKKLEFSELFPKLDKDKQQLLLRTFSDPNELRSYGIESLIRTQYFPTHKNSLFENWISSPFIKEIRKTVVSAPIATQMTMKNEDNDK